MSENNGLGTMQCAFVPAQHNNLEDTHNLFASIGKPQGKNNVDDPRCDSGVCLSGSSLSSFHNSVPSWSDTTSFSTHRNTLLEKTDSAIGLEQTSSLQQRLKNLCIKEESIDEDIDPDFARQLDENFAKLRARTKEQKLRDLENFDYSLRDDSIDDVSEEERLRSDEICRSLTEEDERPPQFEQDEDGDTFLHLMILNKHEAQARQLIDEAPSWPLLNIQNDLGQTVLHLAVLTNQTAIARKLVAHGATLDIRDRLGNTALHLACRTGSLELVLALTRWLKPEDTANVAYSIPFQRIPQPADLLNYDGDTCLQVAAKNRHFAIMKHLIIECQADINQQDWKSGHTLLHHAAESNDTVMMDFLLSHPRINTEAHTYAGYTALKLALGRQNTDVIQLLLLSGASMEDSEEEEEDVCHVPTAMEQEKNDNSDSDFEDFDDMEYQGQAIFPR